MFRELITLVVTALAALPALEPAQEPAQAPAGPSAGPTSGVIRIAHRGASAYAPENTVSAFTLARDQFAGMCEFDVQETKDHELVLMHDTTLARTTDVENVFPNRSPWRVRDFTLAEIRRLDAGSWFSSYYRGEGVPTLAKMLDVMSSTKISLLLEIKHSQLYPGIEQRVADMLRRVRDWSDNGRLVVQAFDWKSMRIFHDIMPKVPIGLLGKPGADQLPKLADYAYMISPQHRDVDADYVRQVHREHMQVYTWTLGDPANIRRMASYDVDGILSNKPDHLYSALG
jgi:glycerophosphoryl diester phosphodiesterase